MKILLIAGHGDGDPGAIGNNYKECTLTRNFIREVYNLSSEFSEELELTLYDTSKDCYKENKKGNIVDFSKYDYTIEIHFNSFSDTSAYGSEILMHPDQKVTFERSFLAEMEKLGFTNRGLKLRDDLLNMNIARKQNANYCLVEVCFISSKADMDRYIASTKNIFKSFLTTLEETFNLASSHFYRVQCGAFKSKQNAINYKKELSEKYGLDCFVVEVN